MNITELDSFSLSDAVKFHNRLNPRIWGKDERLLPEVKQKLLAIAADFQEFLGITDLDVKDITVSGSNAAYTYTPHSDIDLHLVVNPPESHDEVYQELFNAKKYQYNDEHNIKIGGADVELYVQRSDESPVSQGEYSVMRDQWIQVPRRKKHSIDDTCVRAKVEDLDARIQSAIDSNDAERMKSLWSKIKTMRQTGLDKHGEFGCENIAFKILRKHDLLKNLKAAMNAARDRELSLAERNQPRVKKVWGFSEGHYGSSLSSEDGVAPTTCMYLNEEPDAESIIHEFIKHTAAKLGIERMPKINIHTDPAWSIDNHSFGRYQPETHELDVTLPDRHLLDILRTIAHELTHCRQNEIADLPMDAGKTGSEWENEAHASAGIIMRDFADAHPELFDNPAIKESASGYIPTAREKNDPRYSMALTVDIKPGEVGRQANKMGLKTNKQGRPGLLMKTANMIGESRQPKTGYGAAPLTQEPGGIEDEYGNQEATGPEFPPKFPEGTTKIDVSDVYDWYKIGQKISDMDDIDPEDVGQGPPQTVITFPSDEAEQAYLKQFKRLGLKTHDIDAGREHYHEDLVKQLAEEFALLEDEYLGEIRMSPSSLRAEAAKTGAMAGMEFEMIVPNVKTDEEPEYEIDMDQDQRTRSISDIRDFFYDGDYNGRRDVDRLEEAIREQYEEWLYEQLGEAWDNQGEEYLKEYIEVNDEFDEEEATEEATNQLQAEYGDDISPEDFQKMLDAMVAEKLDEFVQEAWADRGRLYDRASEQFMDEMRDELDDEDQWLRDNYPYMSDISENFDIQWPYYTTNEGDGEMDIGRVADDFSSAVGMKVNWSSSYHGGRREPDAYVVEPDGSLDPDDSNDGGLEFVSPPMPIDKMIDQLNKVKAWAGDYGCYTNSSTGLHINISIPNYSLRELDYVKLALLLGDQYVLDQFGRSSNTYAKSALGKVKNKIREYPDASKALLDKMRGHMEDLATKAIHSGTTDKYTSINTKEGYIEFRSPGGDWLDANFDKIENTLLRFTVALSAAMDPQAYREEYLKKLYKLLEPVAVEQNKDTIQYFADYVAGKTPKAALRSFIKQAQLERQVKRGQAGDQQMWWRVSNPTYSHGEIEVVATTKEEAIDKALGPDGYPSWARTRQSVQAVPVRPYDKSTSKASGNEPQAAGDFNFELSQTDIENRLGWPDQTGDANYEVVNRNTLQPVYLFIANTDQDAQRKYSQIIQAMGMPGAAENYGYRARGSVMPPIRQQVAQPSSLRPTNPDGNYVIFANNSRAGDPPAYRFMAADNDDADTVLLQWSREHPGEWEVHYDGNQRLGQPPVPGSTIDLQRQRAAQSAAQPAQQPAATGEFTGQWQVMFNGEELTRIAGIGNNQADANRVGRDYVLQQIRAGRLQPVQGAEIEVLPVMA